MTATLPNPVKADIVEHVAKAIAGTDDEARRPAAVRAAVERAATENGMLDREVLDLVKKHGYPRPETMLRAAALIRGGKPTPTEATPTAWRTTATTTTRGTGGTSHTPIPAGVPSDPTQLLAAAAHAAGKRPRRLAEKIHADLTRLHQALTDEAKTAEAKRQSEAEKRAARAEVERLERQLAAAKAKLRPAATSTAKRTPTTTTSGVNSKEVRAWAAAHGVTCPPVGRVPRNVLAAYDAAHPTQATG